MKLCLEITVPDNMVLAQQAEYLKYAADRASVKLFPRPCSLFVDEAVEVDNEIVGDYEVSATLFRPE